MSSGWWPHPEAAPVSAASNVKQTNKGTGTNGASGPGNDPLSGRAFQSPLLQVVTAIGMPTCQKTAMKCKRLFYRQKKERMTSFHFSGRHSAPFCGALHRFGAKPEPGYDFGARPPAPFSMQGVHERKHPSARFSTAGPEAGDATDLRRQSSPRPDERVAATKPRFARTLRSSRDKQKPELALRHAVIDTWQ